MYEVGTRHLQGVQGRYEAPTAKGTRQEQDIYMGYEAGIQGIQTGSRHLQGIQACRYETLTRYTKQVQGTYKGYELGMRHLQSVQGGYKTPTRGMK